MSQFFTSSAPLAIKPVEINGKHSLLNKYKQAEKAARRIMAEGFPRLEKFTSTEAISEYLGGDRITCLMCGRSFKGLCAHLSRIHKMSTDDYKERYGLPFRAGLQINALTKIYSERGKRPQHIAMLKKLRSPENIALFRASASTQRTSNAKRMQSRKNVAKAPLSTNHFKKEDVEKIIEFMVKNDCSLSLAVRETRIMAVTCFKKMVKKFPEIDFSAAMKSGSKGNRNPLIKNIEAIEKIKTMRSGGMKFKEIGKNLGIHEEYASLLHRRAA